MKVTLGPGLDQVQTGLKPGFVKPGLNPVHKSCEIQNKTWSRPGLDQVLPSQVLARSRPGFKPTCEIGPLCLNAKKYIYILFRPRNYTTNISQNRIYLNGEEVDQINNINNETSFKFLGLHVDESLTWKYHVKKVCARIARSNYILNKVKNFLPYSTLNTLYMD